ncbi:FkbM family methyltransferase [Azospirillum sp. TSA6c]|uniref:FkbM family methyltransferase n=1 Tax=unclassified Azospirillum TaxID=2630922 RepID=UPI000D658223|nr:FkbM family methyltransferase [Azospirillum sp. TSA6c]
MLTLFSVPKPFVGHIGVIQRNAIRSWMQIEPRSEIILFGDEAGVAEMAREHGLTHVPALRLTSFGTPLIDDIFRKAQDLAANPFLCYVNADIILPPDIGQLAPAVAALHPNFLMVGQRIDVDISHELDFAGDWRAELSALSAGATWHDVHGIDFMIFRRHGLRGYMPPFAVGRVMWDNWMMYWARILGLLVLDVTLALRCYHQNHDYAHAMAPPGGNDDIYGEPRLQTPEQNRNKLLAFHEMFAFNIGDATHCLVDGRILPSVHRGWRPRAASRQALPFGCQWLPAPDVLSRQVLYNQFEPNEVAFVQAFLKPGMVAVDVGSHHGFYTLLASMLVGEEGRVLAVEASPREFVRLRMHLALNDRTNVVAWEGALGAEERQGVLRVRLDTESGLNGLRASLMPPVPVTFVPCTVGTLDAVLVETGFDRVDLLKIDVAGGETDVIEGATALLSRFPRPIILCDMDERLARSYGESKVALYRQLAGEGFHWFIAGDGGILLEAGPDFCSGPLIAVPEERLADVASLRPDPHCLLSPLDDWGTGTVPLFCARNGGSGLP